MLVWVNTDLQSLSVYAHSFTESPIKIYNISTAKLGLGENKNSWQTPRGWHIIRAKIGAGLPANTVFVARRPTGEIYDSGLDAIFPDRDWILTRILWLSGQQIGFNRLGDCDSMQRYIYIHATPQKNKLGVANSKGCIRMHNTDIIELFDLIPCYSRVYIGAKQYLV